MILLIVFELGEWWGGEEGGEERSGGGVTELTVLGMGQVMSIQKILEVVEL